MVRRARLAADSAWAWTLTRRRLTHRHPALAVARAGIAYIAVPTYPRWSPGPDPNAEVPMVAPSGSRLVGMLGLSMLDARVTDLLQELGAATPQLTPGSWQYAAARAQG